MEVLAPTVVQVDPDPQTRKRKIHCKQELIVSSLQRFYALHPDKEEVIGLLDGTSTMSLRLIDWFVTNYAKQESISYILNGQEFLVYTNYKSQLKAYSKKLFDPFCRRERIYFQIPGTPAFVTTVGKLNFFRWAIEKGVLNYIKMNMKTLEEKMAGAAKEAQKARKTPTSEASTQSTSSSSSTVRSVTRKRLASAVNPTAKTIQKHEFDVEIRFD
jgi:hypothetical protein